MLRRFEHVKMRENSKFPRSLPTGIWKDEEEVRENVVARSLNIICINMDRERQYSVAKEITLIL